MCSSWLTCQAVKQLGIKLLEAHPCNQHFDRITGWVPTQIASQKLELFIKVQEQKAWTKGLGLGEGGWGEWGIVCWGTEQIVALDTNGAHN